jgi:hypothetical protein
MERIPPSQKIGKILDDLLSHGLTGGSSPGFPVKRTDRTLLIQHLCALQEPASHWRPLSRPQAWQRVFDKSAVPGYTMEQRVSGGVGREKPPWQSS